MDGATQFSHLCRLCLTDVNVNISIFERHGDVGQTFLKISECLPIGISPDDGLPKKICNNCSCKLDTAYDVVNTSVDSEKTLLTWLNNPINFENAIRESSTSLDIVVKDSLDIGVKDSLDIGVKDCLGIRVKNSQPIRVKDSLGIRVKEENDALHTTIDIKSECMDDSYGNEVLGDEELFKEESNDVNLSTLHHEEGVPIAEHTISNDSLDSDAESVNSNFDDSPNCIEGDNEKHEGKQRRRNCCYYCKKDVLNFARHMLRHHPREDEVMEILSKPPSSQERKQLLTSLRKKGNFLMANHLKPIRKTGRGETDLLPCIHCLGFYSSKQLHRHRRICVQNKTGARSTNSDAQNALLAHLDIDEGLKSKVFKIMRADKIAMVAKKDSLICAVGVKCLNSGRDGRAIGDSSQKMRNLAKMLMEISNANPSIRSMYEALAPKHFNLFVGAAKTCAGYDSEKNTFRSPTFLENVLYSLYVCCDVATEFALEKNDEVSQNNIICLRELFNKNWRYEFSVDQGTIINNWTILDLAKDLILLKIYLDAQAANAVENLLHSDCGKKYYNDLLEIIYCQVALLNRRYCHELQKIYLKSFFEASNCDAESNDFTCPETILLRTCKGLTDSGNPVILNSDIQKNLLILINYRTKFVSVLNPYLFGLPDNSCGSFIHGLETMHKLTRIPEVSRPEALIGNQLKKYVATLYQIFNMNDGEIEQLVRLMGFTLNTSENAKNDVHLCAKIAKLVMLMEDGFEFENKIVDDINVDLDEDILGQKVNVECSFKSQPLKTYPSKSKVKRTLVPWTHEQKRIILNHFKGHVKRKKPPKKSECDYIIHKYPDILWNKSWQKIKAFIQNVYTKKYSKL